MTEKILGFVHLHTHSEYSMLDGLIRLDELVKCAVEYKMPAVAVTDHGNMFGAVEFFEEATKAKVKPIIGCETYLARDSRLSRDRSEGSPFHLVLLCRNDEGYKNLCQLITASYLEGFITEPRIDRELLEKHGKGLIALSACLQGEIPQLLLAGKKEEAATRLEWYQSVFGRTGFSWKSRRMAWKSRRASTARSWTWPKRPAPRSWLPTTATTSRRAETSSRTSSSASSRAKKLTTPTGS